MMKSNVEKMNGLQHKLNIVVPAPVVQSAFQKVFSGIQKEVTIKGFRKGKAPIGMIRKFFVQDISKKTVDQVINDAYSSATKDIDFQIISSPQIEPENQFDENRDFNFTASVDINPKVDMKDYKNLSIKLDEKLKVNLDDEYEKVISFYAKTFGTSESVTDRAVQDGDNVIVDYTISSQDQELNGQESKGVKLELADRLLPEFKNALLNMKIGESTKFDVSYPTHFEEPKFAGKTCTYSLTLNAIEQTTPAERNDELAGKLGFKTFEELTKHVKNDISSAVLDTRVNAAFEQVIDQVLANNSFDVADSLIDNTIERMAQEAKKDPKDNTSTPESKEQYREQATKQVKGILALGHIARQENITVSTEELIQEVSNFSRANRINPQEIVKRFGNRIYDEFRGQVMVRKVINFILEQSNLQYSKST